MRMGNLEEGQNLERMFTLSEANRLIPELERHLTLIGRSKELLGRVKDEIKKASAKASLGGGSSAGRVYIAALEQMSEHLQAIQEMGVLVKDLDTGLCDFPHHMEGRIVYLCWKRGETEIRWWHDLHSGYSGRQPLESQQ
jgi:uncharacterized protein YciI